MILDRMPPNDRTTACFNKTSKHFEQQAANKSDRSKLFEMGRVQLDIEARNGQRQTRNLDPRRWTAFIAPKAGANSTEG